MSASPARPRCAHPAVAQPRELDIEIHLDELELPAQRHLGLGRGRERGPSKSLSPTISRRRFDSSRMSAAIALRVEQEVRVQLFAATVPAHGRAPSAAAPPVAFSLATRGIARLIGHADDCPVRELRDDDLQKRERPPDRTRDGACRQRIDRLLEDGARDAHRNVHGEGRGPSSAPDPKASRQPHDTGVNRDDMYQSASATPTACHQAIGCPAYA